MTVIKPVVGGSIDVWGTILNAALDLLDARTTANTLARPISVKDYGAVGDGVTDDTAAVIAAFAAANALARVGLGPNIFHPGATVVIPGGVYNLATLAAPIVATCNVRTEGAMFIVPAAYAGVAVLVGHPTSGRILQSADITVPDVMKPTSSAIVAGSVGVAVQNLYSSRVMCGRTAYFETGQHYTGLGEGTCYNQFFIGWVSYCQVSVRLKPQTGGWVNQNTFVGGGIQQSSGYGGGGLRRTGWRHMVLDGSGTNQINGNNFFGVSFEGDVSEYCFWIKAAWQNNWYGCRHESGSPFVPVTVSGDTITAVAHGLVVGDMIIPTATVAPTGMAPITPYYVVTVPDADTFKISRKKAGAAITFGSTGTTVVYSRPHRIYLDTSSGGTNMNVIQNIMSPTMFLDIVHSSAIRTGNQQRSAYYQIHDAYLPEDLPMFRARNAYPAVNRAHFAAYPQGVDPYEDPEGWTAALSDRGLIVRGIGGPIVCGGTGAPEFIVTAPQGSIYLRTGGGAATTFYVKESGAGNTGWIAK